MTITIKGLERIAGQSATEDAAKLKAHRLLEQARTKRIRQVFVEAIYRRGGQLHQRPDEKEVRRRRAAGKVAKRSRRRNRR